MEKHMKKFLVLALLATVSFPSFAGKTKSTSSEETFDGARYTKENCYSILEALHKRLERHAERHEAGQEEHKVDINDTKRAYKALQKCIEKELIDTDVIIMPEIPDYWL
jgi:flagellar motility protein MotE (MotC chaperone)